MTLSQGYRQALNAMPHLDYPYLSIPDVDEDNIDYEYKDVRQ